MTTEAATPDTGTEQELSVEQRLEAFFQPPVEDTATEEHADEPDEESDDVEIEDVEDDDEIKADADDDSAEDDEDQDEATYTVRVAGEDVEVTLPELLAGYSRTGDYKRKTQQLADERREVEAERETFTAKRSEYEAALPQLRALIESSIGPEPKESEYPNRADYLYAKDQWYEAKRSADAVRAEQERIQSERQREQAQAVESYRAQQAEKLAERMPEWSDTQIKQRDQAAIADYMRGEGWSDEEIAQLWDHRAVIAINKARLYDAAQANGKKRVKAVKAKTKAAEPGTRELGTRGRNYRKQRERLKETGSIHDAAALLEGAFQPRK